MCSIIAAGLANCWVHVTYLIRVPCESLQEVSESQLNAAQVELTLQ